jgi:hypothetical protein
MKKIVQTFVKALMALQSNTVAILCIVYKFLFNHNINFCYMKKIFFDFRDSGRASSTNELFTKELAQIVGKFNLKFKRGGLKILKKPIYYSGVLSCLLVLLAFTFMAVGCEKPKDVPTGTTTTTNLAGTSWKLAGIVDILTGEMTILEPKDCEQCYTLTFLTDSTAQGFSVSCKITLDLSLLGSYMIEDIGEFFDGDIFRSALYSQNTKSYIVTETELKFINNKGNYYLLFKYIEK